jgi:hypothetical protein
MLDIYEVLYQKERDLRRLRREIEMLTTVIPLLAEEADGERQLYQSASAGATIIQFDRTPSPSPRKSSRRHKITAPEQA